MENNTVRQRLAAEALGTAFLVFVGVGSVPALALARGGSAFGSADLGFISLSFATIVTATVYVFGYVSGNHVNPAVTLALAATGRFPWREVPGYVVAQTVGACVGAFAIVGALGHRASTLGLGVASYTGIPWWQAFTAEFLGTFVLVFTVFGVVDRRAAPGFAGIVIGLVVFAVIIPVAPATGASVNPARTSGPMLVQQLLGGQVHWSQWPVYVAAELLAGVIAGLASAAVSTSRADRSTARAAVGEPETV